VVCDFAGLPQRGRDQFAAWADITTNLNGPRTPRTGDDLAKLGGMLHYIHDLAARQHLHPDRIGQRIYQAAHRRKITLDEATNLLWGALIVAGLHSSIAFFGHLVLALGHFPDQWQTVREPPELMATLVDEVIRYDTPIPDFFRTARSGAVVDGYEIPEGARVMLMYASANHDPRHWDQPTAVDVNRYTAKTRARTRRIRRRKPPLRRRAAAAHGSRLPPQRIRSPPRRRVLDRRRSAARLEHHDPWLPDRPDQHCQARPNLNMCRQALQQGHDPGPHRHTGVAR
jgi:cytochrome P450